MTELTKFPVIDGHMDTVTRILKQNRVFSEFSENGHYDLPRMKKGNVQAALFALFPLNTMNNVINGLDLWFTLVSNPINGLKQVKTIEDFDRIKDIGMKGAILHFEGAGGIDDDFRILRIGYHLGLRTMGLTWANINKFGTGAKFGTRQRKTGLTDKGRDLIAEAQSLGITIDVSHLNDPSFWDVYEITERPIIATHSNARSITNHPRNLTDDQIKAIHEKHGTIGINFSMGFLNSENPGKDNIDLGFDIIKNHIDHMISLADINIVAMGSDFDGTSVPNCVKDCTTFPLLWDYLLKNGYSEQDIDKISHGNLLRVFKETWK